MSQFPHLPLFTDAWVAGTHHLSRTERGTYLDLLILMWRSPHCRLPNDDRWLAKHLNMSLDEVVKELRPIISEFCKKTKNFITQKRLLQQWNYVQEKTKKAANSAKRRWEKEKDQCEGNASGGCEGNATKPKPKPKPKIDIDTNVSISPAKKKKPKTDFPDGWELAPDELEAKAVELDWPKERVLSEFSRFRNNALAKNCRYADWPRAWANWCTSPYQRAPSAAVSSLTDEQRAWKEMRNDLRKSIQAAEDSEAGRSVVRLFPTVSGQ